MDESSQSGLTTSTCPKCGYQNIQLAKFCQSCGTPLPAQPSSQPIAPAPAPYYTLPPRRGIRSEEKAIIIVVALVAILVVGVVATVFIFYSPFSFISQVTPRPVPVVVTGFLLHIQYPNSASNGYFGPATRVLNTPFIVYLQHGEHFQLNLTLTLAANAVAHSVNSISFTFSPGLTLVSVNPNPPVSIQPGFPVRFTVTCQAPNSDYAGPATLDLFTS